MRWFSASTRSVARVSASRAEVWSVLTDPPLLAHLTPFLASIEPVDADHWRWQMTSIPVVGLLVVPTFTERMTFTDDAHIAFTHDPPASPPERAAAEGRYDLTDVAGGVELAIALQVSVELPLTRLAGPAVTVAMRGVLAGMGSRFSTNLLHHLGAHPL